MTVYVTLPKDVVENPLGKCDKCDNPAEVVIDYSDGPVRRCAEHREDGDSTQDTRQAQRERPREQA